MRLNMPRVIAATAILAVASCAGQARQPEGEYWQSLFDGKTLDGWTPKIRGFPLGENYRDTFKVRDGVLRVSYENYDKFGERFGHLFYKTPFKAYKLRLDYRFIDGTPADTAAWALTNSGVMIFSQDPRSMAVGDSFPVSVEAQILGQVDGVKRTNGNMCSPGTNVTMNGVLVTEHCINAPTPALPNGTWVQFEIDVLPDGQVVQKQNGVVTITYSNPELDPEGRMANSKPLIAAANGKLALDSGYICLQSEGAPIEFRNIQIMELN
jgi:hypothetical protein